MRAILLAIVAVAFTDIALQLDNAISISAIASTLPPTQRTYVLAGGVLLAAIFLFSFTLIGSELITRVEWLKPVAGGVLVILGASMIWSFFRH